MRLTNQLHELELKNVMTSSGTSVPPSPGGPLKGGGGPGTPLGFGSRTSVHRTASNGISFDSDKGEFKEFVDVMVQTSEKTNTVRRPLLKVLKAKLPRVVVYYLHLWRIAHCGIAAFSFWLPDADLTRLVLRALSKCW